MKVTLFRTGGRDYINQQANGYTIKHACRYEDTKEFIIKTCSWNHAGIEASAGLYVACGLVAEKPRMLVGCGKARSHGLVSLYTEVMEMTNAIHTPAYIWLLLPVITISTVEKQRYKQQIGNIIQKNAGRWYAWISIFCMNYHHGVL